MRMIYNVGDRRNKFRCALFEKPTGDRIRISLIVKTVLAYRILWIPVP